jgi:SAM-dependent methyltransferase
MRRFVPAVPTRLVERDGSGAGLAPAISFKTPAARVHQAGRPIKTEVQMSSYVHGYGPREVQRLQDQASTLVELLHADTSYPPGARVLEAGCGVGAQTVTLASRSPLAQFVAFDRDAPSLAKARAAVAVAGFANVAFEQADLFALPFAPNAFDHVFLCFVLEHLDRPREALRALGELIRPNGTITAIEGDHGSASFHPDSDAARRAIGCQVALQAGAGGDAMIGRRLYPLLVDAGFAEPRVSPRLVYADGSRPDLAEGFTRRTFTAMVAGVRAAALEAGLMAAADFDRGIADLNRTAEADGVFCYSFFKAVAVKY